LHRNAGKIIPIELLNSVGETYPAKVVFIKGHIYNGALQQAFIYVIPETIVLLNSLRIATKTRRTSNKKEYYFFQVYQNS
jgi:hypothetical protein